MAKLKCDHCKLGFDESAMIHCEDGHKFCCNGCKQVFYLLQENGLEEFYTRLGKNTLNPAKTREISKNETEAIYENFVRQNADGFNEIFIIIEGIHCSACVWLNEKVLFNSKGVIEANINATTNKAKIVWDENETNLAEIFSKIKSIGYEPYPYDPNRSETRINSKRREFYAKLIVGIFSVMNIMWIAVALYGGYFSGMDAATKDILHFGEFILATPVLFYTGSVFFKGAFFAIKNRTPNMDLLIATGSGIVYIYSVYAMLARNGEVYFDSVAMIITFVFIGKYLEILSKKRATDKLDNFSNTIIGAVLVKNEKGGFINKKADEISIGDEILLNEGAKVLIDGCVISGNASFDYASINGESVPVSVQTGDEIKSGAICMQGSVIYRASANFKNSLLSKIIDLLENAPLKKPQIERMANEISGIFSIVILTLAALTFFIWLYFGSFDKALITAVSVIIIACPCALGLATPVATLVGLGAGLKEKILFKEAKTIENIAKCDTIVFDKTGTLTNGKLKVNKSKFLIDFDISLLDSLLKASNHPISKAVNEFLNFKGENLKISNIRNFPAKGISANFGNIKISGGSAKFMRELGIKNVEHLDTSEYFFAINGKLAAIFELSDSIKNDAKSSVSELEKLGFEIFMLSGDNENAVKKIADEIGIKNYESGVLPDKKANFVQNLSKRNKFVIMVGDGVNDAPALSLANVGICLGSGADISMEKSDVVLLTDDLASLVCAIKIAKKSFKKVKENLIFSLCYNAITIPLACLGFIIPLYAAISMSFSSLIVVLNSLRLKNFRR